MLAKTIRHFIQQSWLLIVSSFFFGLLLAVTNAAWSPRIEQNKIDKLNKLMSGMLTTATEFELAFEDAQIDTGKGKVVKINIYKALGENGNVVGWAFNCSGSGFADKIELVVTLDADAKKLDGYDVLSSNETPGFGDRIKFNYYRDQFIGAPAEKLTLTKTENPKLIDKDIVAITGATVSSEAVITTINSYIEPVTDLLQEKGLISNE